MVFLNIDSVIRNFRIGQIFKNNLMDEQNQIIIYKNKENNINLEVNLKEETVWLTQKDISKLFGVLRPAITKHLKNIFETGELSENSVSSILEHTAKDGKIYNTKFYNLDVIISVGYQVNSKQGTQFRIWATNILKKHLVEGYTLNEKRLKEENSKLIQLKNAVELINNVLERKEIESDEAQGLLKVI